VRPVAVDGVAQVVARGQEGPVQVLLRYDGAVARVPVPDSERASGLLAVRISLYVYIHMYREHFIQYVASRRRSGARTCAGHGAVWESQWSTCCTYKFIGMITCIYIYIENS